MAEVDPDADSNNRKKQELTELGRKNVEKALLTFLDSDSSNQNNPKLRKGGMAYVAKKFGLSDSYMSKIWKKMQENHSKHGTFFSTLRKKGRKRVYIPELLSEAIEEIPNHQIKTRDELALALGMSSGSLASVKHFMKNEEESDGGLIVQPHNQDSDSDSDEEFCKWDGEPLRRGDIIAYYHPSFVAGNPLGLRVAQVVKITRNREKPLWLTNHEHLPRDTYVQRIQTCRNGVLIPYCKGERKAIEEYKYKPGKALHESEWATEDEVDRLQRILEDGRRAVLGWNPRDHNDDADDGSSMDNSEDEIETVAEAPPKQQKPPSQGAQLPQVSNCDQRISSRGQHDSSNSRSSQTSTPSTGFSSPKHGISTEEVTGRPQATPTNKEDRTEDSDDDDYIPPSVFPKTNQTRKRTHSELEL